MNLSLADLKKAVDKAFKEEKHPESIEVEIRTVLGNQPPLAFMTHTGTPKFVVRTE
jgi:hypothetical protein